MNLFLFSISRLYNIYIYIFTEVSTETSSSIPQRKEKEFQLFTKPKVMKQVYAFFYLRKSRILFSFITLSVPVGLARTHTDMIIKFTFSFYCNKRAVIDSSRFFNFKLIENDPIFPLSELMA